MICLVLFVLLLAIVQAQAQAVVWERAAYWDARYPGAWGGAGDAVRDALQAAGYTVVNADQLKTWMNARIADKKPSVVVFCKDVAPDTVAETMSATCTLRKYLDAGGKIVWYADWPMYYQGHADGSMDTWGSGGASAVLGFNASSGPNDTYEQVTFTAAGIKWGLTATWQSRRPTSPTITDNLTALATVSSGSAAAWVKHYVTGDKYRGFVRLYDTAGTPSPDDVIRLAEYYGYFKASDPIPANGAPSVLTPLVQWTAGDNAAFHDVYFGTNPTPGPAEFRGRQTWTMYWHGPGITPGTTYYWRIDEVEADGVTVHKGDVWSFTAAPFTAHNPNPRDGAKWVDIEADLSWSAGATGIKHDVYLGTDQTAVANGTGGTLKSSQQTTATYDPGTLAKGTTYYWRIDEYNSGGTKYPGNVWSFKTLPDIPISDPDLVCWWKLDEGEGTAVIDWSGHGHHGRFFGDPQWVAGYDGGAVDLDGGDDYVDFASIADLPSGTSARSMCGWGKTNNIAGGWRWIAAYGTPGTSQAMFIGLNGTDLYGGGYGDDVLEAGFWEIGVWHHICLTYDGTTAKLYADGILVDSAAKTWSLVLSRAHIGRQVNDLAEFWNGLVDDVRIYKKALTPEEIRQAMRGDPRLAWNPKPANEALTDVERAVPLSWSPGEKAAQHDVYLGTDRAAVADATTASTGIYRGRQVAANYTPPEGVQWGGGPYYWRIDEYNTDGTISTGRVWSFTVADYLIVDDFEDYTDDIGSRIFQTWKDGWGFNEPAPGYPGNGTGSTVGYAQAPFAEQSIVHSGGQSMPLGYDNSGTGGKARYSETQREWTSTLDWTKYTLKALTVYFYGALANAAEQLYVALEDNAGHVKVVSYPDVEAVQKAAWQEWNIELTQFSGAGVNLKAIKKMYIGLGNRTSPKAGGTGTIYIDDIRVYASRCVPSMGKPAADLSGNCIVDEADVEILANLWLDSGLQITPVNPGTAGLVAQYPFNGNANDAVGGHNGTVSGTPTYAAGRVSQAIQLNGVDQMVDVGAVGISGAAPRTIAGWARGNATVGALPDWINIFGFTGPSGDNGHFDIELVNVGARGYGIHVYGWERLIMPIDLNWHHLAASYDGTTIKWYGDGQLIGSDSSRILNTPNNVHMGKRDDNENYWPGRVDEVYIYNRVLSGPEIGWLAGYRSAFSVTADLHQDGVINFKDFAVLADSWLEQIMWP